MDKNAERAEKIISEYLRPTLIGSFVSESILMDAIKQALDEAEREYANKWLCDFVDGKKGDEILRAVRNKGLKEGLEMAAGIVDKHAKMVYRDTFALRLCEVITQDIEAKARELGASDGSPGGLI